jgi:hypothetical protein
MEDAWFLLLFVAVALVGPMVSARMGFMGSNDELEASFAEQDVSIDGTQVPATPLEVLHRASGNASRGRSGDVTMDAQWLCRYGNDVYLLAMAQGATVKGGW